MFPVGTRRAPALWLPALWLVCACGGPEGRDAAARHAAVIRVDGSSTVYPITEAVAEEYQKVHQGTRVTVGTLGHRRRLPEVLPRRDGRQRRLPPDSPAEIAECARAGVEFVELPVAYDGIAVVVQPRNTWARSMTVAELRRLWNLPPRAR